jgi:hypothetical protein
MGREASKNSKVRVRVRVERPPKTTALSLLVHGFNHPPLLLGSSASTERHQPWFFAMYRDILLGE